MRNKRVLFITTLFCLILWIEQAAALQTVDVSTAQSPTFVFISQKNLNLIRISSPEVRAFTSSKSLEVKIKGSDIFVSFTDPATASPQELFFVTPASTFSLILVPKGIPAETIIVKTPINKDKGEALKWESSNTYIAALKDLIKSMYVEVPPPGFSTNKFDVDVTRWKGTKETLTAVYTGATLEGEAHKIVNTDDKLLRIHESEFYAKGILAVSIDKHELLPKEETMVYFVKKSEGQKRLEDTISKNHPLDVLSGKKPNEHYNFSVPPIMPDNAPASFEGSATVTPQSPAPEAAPPTQQQSLQQPAQTRMEKEPVAPGQRMAQEPEISASQSEEEEVPCLDCDVPPRAQSGSLPIAPRNDSIIEPGQQPK